MALAAWGWITYQAKQRDTNGLHVFGALAVDAAVACAFTWAAITIAINYRQYDIMTDELWRLTGPGIFPGLQLDALIGMLAVGAVARALIPGRIYEDIGTRKIDYFFILRWFALAAAIIPAAIHMNVNYDSLPAGSWALTFMVAGSAGLLLKAMYIKFLARSPSTNTADQVLRGSQLISASSLADQIRSRLKMK